MSLEPSSFLHLLIAPAAVVVLGRLFGRVLAAIGQPPVIGEVLAGIALGPSLLGLVSPDASRFILPPAVAPLLSGVAQVGVAVYMFLVGVELNGDLVRSRVRTTVLISQAGIVLPFALGWLLALAFFDRLSTPDVPFPSFALFMGVAMSITAFPVLARILTDRGMSQTELGAVALASAAADDVTAWCLLALVVGVTQASVESAFVVIALTLAFIVLMFLGVRPLVARTVRRIDRQQPSALLLTLTLTAAALSAATTEGIGVHAIFGAFLFGTAIPHDSRLALILTGRFKTVVTTCLLPAFFAYTGMRTRIGLVSGASEWLMCGLIILVATAGKFGGVLTAARLTGMDWRGAVSLGVLMNTRGLMELVVLNIGLDLGVISPGLFTMMVIMALVTTIATTPVLQLLGVGAPTVALQYNSRALSR